jgi:hypothetical protein
VKWGNEPGNVDSSPQVEVKAGLDGLIENLRMRICSPPLSR